MSTLCSLFGAKSRREISQRISRTRGLISRSSLCSLHIGCKSMSRSALVDNHTTAFAKRFFGTDETAGITRPVVVVDGIVNETHDITLFVDIFHDTGTYIYTEKSSSDHTFQRKSFTDQKKRNLVKPMVIVSTTGYIIDIVHPYLARNNDAMILKHFIETSGDDLIELLGDNGVILADRGFRDVAQFLQDMGIKCILPAFLSKSQKTMSVGQANETRKLTKVRWVVESAIGRLKRNALFRNTVPNAALPTIAIDFRISAALINKFKVPLVTDTDTSAIWAAQMLKMMKSQNKLQLRFEAGEIKSKKKSMWHKITTIALVEFPMLSDSDLRDLCFGSFQVNQGRHYVSDQLHNRGAYEIMVSNVETGLIQVTIQSRHRSAKKWRVFVRFAPERQTLLSQQYDIDVEVHELSQKSTAIPSTQSKSLHESFDDDVDSEDNDDEDEDHELYDQEGKNENEHEITSDWDHSEGDQESIFPSSHLDDIAPAFKKIIGWFCTCLAGSRTVGMCSHVASVIWYLGIGRHQPERKLYKWSSFFGDAPTVAQGSDNVPSGSEDSEVDQISPKSTQNIALTQDLVIEIDEPPNIIPQKRKLRT